MRRQGLSKEGSAHGKRGRRRTGRGEMKSPFEGMTPVRADVAGIDIGSEEHFAAVRVGDEMVVDRFGCFTPDLQAMAAWFKERGIQFVVMESTGVYWIPVYQVLEEAGFNVTLVDARYAKNLPGRKKTDVHDCCWLHKLHSYGMLKPCYVPSKEVGEMRAYWRQRSALVNESSRQILLIHKALEQMNMQLHKVLSDVAGLTGMRIIRSILNGERDPAVLARHRHHRVQASEETIAKALTGNWRPEHLFALKQAVDAYDFVQQQIQECHVALQAAMEKYRRRVAIPVQDEVAVIDEGTQVGPDTRCSGSEPSGVAASSGALEQPTRQATEGAGHSDRSTPVEGVDTTESASGSGAPKRRRRRNARNDPQFDLHQHLIAVTGVDLTEIDGIDVLTAQTVISECGPDLAAFETENRFVSWLGLCPNNRVTGGRVKSSSTNKNNNRAAQALRVAAQSLWHSKTALGAYFRRMNSRLARPAAITAVAHKLARLVFRMIRYGKDYVDRGQQWYEEQYRIQRQHQLARHARDLGLVLLVPTTGEVVS